MPKYRVGYYVEEGYFVTVDAPSEEEAEDMVSDALNEGRIEELGVSDQVHGEHGVTLGSTELIKRGE
jgi:hypothetical protein